MYIFFNKVRQVSWKTTAIVVAGLFLAIIAFQSILTQKAQASTGITLTGYAWSSNIGWISFNNCQNGACGSVKYSVKESSSGVLSGHAWSSNIGWISFNSSELAGCPSGACIAKVEANGNVTGWARALSAGGANSGGWDGWISLSGAGAKPYGVIQYPSTAWGGYAWGGGSNVNTGVVGWISFNGLQARRYCIRPVGVSSCSPVPAACLVTTTGALTASPDRVNANSKTPVVINWSVLGYYKAGTVVSQCKIVENGNTSIPLTSPTINVNSCIATGAVTVRVGQQSLFTLKCGGTSLQSVNGTPARAIVNITQTFSNF